MKVAVSYFKSDDYKTCIDKIDKSNADYIHADLCDGKYVETKNFTIKEFQKLMWNVNKKISVHFMCLDPIKYIEDLVMLNIETIYIHINACKDLNKTISFIKELGFKVGLVLNPDESISLLDSYLNDIDEVLVMSVIPGKGGQSFIEDTIYKINDLKILKDKYNFILAVDGGINNETINFIKDKVDIVISGSYITNSIDYNEKINSLI